jgi:hypothetical protein
MQDDLFIRQWTATHDEFSADLDRGLGHLLRRFSRRERATKPIGSSYGFLAKYEAEPAPRQGLSPRAQASLRGLAASVITFALWVTVMLVATPAPGFASSLDAPAPQPREYAVPALA